MRFSIPTVPRKTVLIAALVVVCVATIASQRATSKPAPPPPARWWRGNLHAHSNWVDGDDFPEMVADNYKRRGYNFLVLSSHNAAMMAGPRWRDLGVRGVTLDAINRCRRRFGKRWLETRILPDGRKQVRLKRIEEIRPALEKTDRFLLVQGEEITDQAWRGPVHLNVMNIRDVILPQGGGDRGVLSRARRVTDVLAVNIAAVEKQRRRTGQPMLLQINHPNYHWAITAEHIAGARGARFFEVFNGHPGVHNYGDDRRASTERMWDIALTLRRSGQAATTEPLYGVAVDDAHHYHGGGMGGATPGRGWIMVRAPILRAPDLIAAMEKGDFYASTGVRLRDVRYSGGRLSLKIAAEPGVTYTTRFIGTRRGFDRRSTEVVFGSGRRRRYATRRYSKDVGAVLAEVNGASPRYTLRGDELYVRATILSSRSHPNPYRPGDKQMAWTQPIFPDAR